MTIHILVEGPSERAFIEPWAARLLKNHPVKVHPHEGKGKLPQDPSVPPARHHRGLLHQLPAKLRAFADALNPDADSVLILVDADNEHCVDLTTQLRDIATTFSPGLRVVVRIAVEETEAFYLGDLKAVQKAFPDADMASAREYVPDSICSTWEFFGRVVRDGGGNKVAWAEAIGPHLTTNPAKSRSLSFRALCRGLLRLATSGPSKERPKKKYRHIARSERVGKKGG